LENWECAKIIGVKRDGSAGRRKKGGEKKKQDGAVL